MLETLIAIALIIFVIAGIHTVIKLRAALNQYMIELQAHFQGKGRWDYVKESQKEYRMYTNYLVVICIAITALIYLIFTL